MAALTEHRIRAAERARRALTPATRDGGGVAQLPSLDAVTGVLRQRGAASAAPPEAAAKLRPARASSARRP